MGSVGRRQFLAAAGALVAAPRLALPGTSTARRVGVLRVRSIPPTFIDPFRAELRALGYVEGKTLVIDYGFAPSVPQLPEVAEQLAGRVEVLVASGTPSVMPARGVSHRVPVVFVAAIDPVASGLVSSLAHPGGNITGVSAVHADAIGKRLQMIMELLPNASRVALMVRETSPATAQYVREAQLAMRTLGLELQVLGVRSPADLDAAFAKAKGASALLQVDDAMLTAQRKKIAALALEVRVPTVSGLSESVEAGGLMSYGPHYGDLYQRAGRLVHAILKGIRPANLPVEQPTRFELVINLKTANTLGVTIPQSMLHIADKLIE
jgi:putative ABC transport system substrate-binding protein